MVEDGQVYEELGGKKRTLRVLNVDSSDGVFVAQCKVGWRSRQGTSWTERVTYVPTTILEDKTLCRLEY